jgi:hypothetical protein
MPIYSSNYECTSYILGVSMVTTEWCENDSHAMPQHVIGTVNWQDYLDGNKCRLILIFSIQVTDTVSICTCHYMFFFHSFYCMLEAS